MSVRAQVQKFPLPNNPLDGQKLFVKKGCVNCHSIMGKGGKIGSDLAKKLAGYSGGGIIAMMWNHSSDMSRAMQTWQTAPKLNENELADLVGYLYSISYFDEPGDPAAGKIVFRKNGCLKCHRVGDQGGVVGPALDKIRRYGSPLFLAQAMWNHSIAMTQKIQQYKYKRPEFMGSDIANLFSYLLSIARRNKDSIGYMVPGSPRNGEVLFREKGCIDCHKIGNEGNAIGPDLTKKYLRFGAATIAGIMWNHQFRMWEKMKQLDIPPPKFEENEMADVIAYLYFLGFQQEAGNPANGKKLVAQKGCIQCHTIGGRGGTTAPTLEKSQRFTSYITIASRMWNHNIDMQKRMKEVNIPFPRFTEQEMLDVLAYIRSQR